MSEDFVDAVFLHRDIDPLVFKHLGHDSKAALRLVSKTVKRAVDKTVRKVEIVLRMSMSVESVSALLNAGWDLEELVILTDDSNNIPSGMLLFGGIRGYQRTNLKKLRIIPNNDTFINAFPSQGFLSSTSLESLDLSCVRLRDEHIKKLATLHWASNLKNLKLRHQDPVGPGSLHHISNISSALTSLELGGVEALASQSVAPLAALTNLKELDLSGTGWKGQDFAELMISLTNLTTLKATYNDFSGIHRHVSDLSMPSLEELDLEYCQLAPAFFTIKFNMPSLETLNLRGNELCADGVLEGFMTQRLPSSSFLDLNCCSINGDWLAEFVAAGHVVCPLLEDLDLTSNRLLGVAGMRALCNSPWKLKSLRLARCDLGSEEIKALTEGNFQWLRSLDLRHVTSAVKAEDLIPLASSANMKIIESVYLSCTVVQNHHEVEKPMVKLLRRA